MNFKVDTKEKFTTITVFDTNFNANVAESLSEYCIAYLSKDVKNVILNLATVNDVDETAANTIVKLQHNFYEAHASFVICNVQKPVEDFLDQLELLEMMNITPTESEAWDIVQMEEIERELLDGDDVDFDIQQS
ncbi:MAG: STAS domain-containing protein [Chitinophagaceae bacterium]|nr:STAS domain-containing protein [Chitinophagaceae bacterium]